MTVNNRALPTAPSNAAFSSGVVLPAVKMSKERRVPTAPRAAAIHFPYLDNKFSMDSWNYLFFLSKATIMSKKVMEASSILFTMPSTMDKIKL